jgi:hypothetical protein
MVLAAQKTAIFTPDKGFETVAEFKYLGMMVTNQNYIHEENMSKLNSGNICCHVVQNPLSSCLLSKNIKIIIYRTINLPLFCMGVNLGLSC